MHIGAQKDISCRQLSVTTGDYGYLDNTPDVPPGKMLWKISNSYPADNNFLKKRLSHPCFQKKSITSQLRWTHESLLTFILVLKTRRNQRGCVHGGTAQLTMVSTISYIITNKCTALWHFDITSLLKQSTRWLSQHPEAYYKISIALGRMIVSPICNIIAIKTAVWITQTFRETFFSCK